jgi:hypothetical protein
MWNQALNVVGKALRHRSWPVPEQDLAVAEGDASGLEAMAEGVL